jgi:hypothetical protein
MINRKLDIVSHLLRTNARNLHPDLEQAMMTWWYNIRDRGGLRLTTVGYHAMADEFGVENWQLAVDDPKRSLTKRTLLEMDQKMEWPYYIDYKNKRVIFFGSQEAIMASLYGDLPAWLKNRPTRAHVHDSH